MLFQSFDEIEEFANAKNRMLVVYDSYVLDVTEFATHHPGGAHLISRFSSKDLTG